jgi:hypothetical protein
MKNAERADGPNPYAFGISGISPAEQAWMPDASGDCSSRTLGWKRFKREKSRITYVRSTYT